MRAAGFKRIGMPKGSAAHKYLGGLRQAYTGETNIEDLNLRVNKSIFRNTVRNTRTQRKLMGMTLKDEDFYEKELVARNGAVELKEHVIDVEGTKLKLKRNRTNWITNKLIEYYQEQYGTLEQTVQALDDMMKAKSKKLEIAYNAFQELWRVKAMYEFGISEEQLKDHMKKEKTKRICFHNVKPGMKDGVEEDPGPNELSFMPDRRVMGTISSQARKTNTHVPKLNEKLTIPMVGMAGKYKYAGPGTKIEYGKLKEPINGLDKIALKHDLEYGRKNNQSRADRTMLKELKEYKPKNIAEKVDKKLITTAMQFKRRYDGDDMYKNNIKIAKAIAPSKKPGMKEGIEINPGPLKNGKVKIKVVETGPMMKSGKFSTNKKQRKGFRKMFRGRGRGRGRGGRNSLVRKERIQMQVNTKIRSTKPRFKMHTTKDGKIILVATEVLTTGIVFNTADVPGTPLLNKTGNANMQYAPVLLNPTTLGLPRLAKVASIFEKFVFLNFKVIFQTGQPSSTQGAVCGFYDPDIGDSFNGQSPNSVYTTAISHKKAKQFSVWEPYMSFINPFKKREIRGSVFDGYYVDYANHGKDQTTQANFWLLSAIAPSSNISNCGNVIIEYACKLWDPTSDPSSSPNVNVGAIWNSWRGGNALTTANYPLFNTTGTSGLTYGAPLFNWVADYNVASSGFVFQVMYPGNYYTVSEWYTNGSSSAVGTSGNQSFTTSASTYGLLTPTYTTISNGPIGNQAYYQTTKISVPTGVLPRAPVGQNGYSAFYITDTIPTVGNGTLLRHNMWVMYCGPTGDISINPTLKAAHDNRDKEFKKMDNDQKVKKVLDEIDQMRIMFENLDQKIEKRKESIEIIEEKEMKEEVIEHSYIPQHNSVDLVINKNKEEEKKKEISFLGTMFGNK